jgi:hypothetical protein
MVKPFHEIYRSAYKANKALIALQIVQKLRAMNPPRRFLTKPLVFYSSGVEPDYWIEVEEDEAVRKVAQRLRDAKVTTFCGAATRRHIPTKTKPENVNAISQESRVTHHESGASNYEGDKSIDSAIHSSALACVIERGNDEGDTGFASEDRRDPPYCVSPMSSAIHQNDDDVVEEADEIPTAATLLDLLGDDF